ncbi:MAG: glycosyltransferase family 39 protein [Flavobacteriales bacterium]
MILRISLTILGLLLLASGLRMYELAGNNLSEDESITLFLINGYKVEGHHDFKVLTELPESFNREDIRKQKTYRNVVDASIRHNGNSFGYHLLLSWWTKVFGNTNYAIRFLSLIFGVLTVVLGYYFARQLFNERTALIAGVLLCMHPLLVEFGQLARAYVPATFFVLLSTYSLYQISVSKRHLWLHIPLYVVAVLITAFCHYLVLYVLIAHILLVLFFHSHKKALIQYSIMAVFMLGLFSVWWYNGGREGEKWNNHEFSLRASEIMSPETSPGKGILQSTISIFGDNTSSRVKELWLGLIYLIIPGIFLYFAFERIRKSEYFRQAMFVLFPIVLYFVFVIVGIFFLPAEQVFDPHYSSFALPFACILLAFGFDRMNAPGGALRILAYPGLFVMLFVMFVSLFPEFFLRDTQSSARFPYHQAADQIEKQSGQADEVVFGSKKHALLTNFYINKKTEIRERIDSTIPEGEMRIMKNGEMLSGYSFQE